MCILPVLLMSTIRIVLALPVVKIYLKYIRHYNIPEVSAICFCLPVSTVSSSSDESAVDKPPKKPKTLSVPR